jgi:hypothetical protein
MLPEESGAKFTHYNVTATDEAVAQSPFKRTIMVHLAVKKYCQATLPEGEWTDYYPPWLHRTVWNVKARRREHCFAFLHKEDAVMVSLVFNGLFTFEKIEIDKQT